MMAMQPTLSVSQWLTLSSEVRAKLKEIFNIPRSSVGNVNYTGKGPQITSDGHTYEDLKAISIENMQKYLGRLDTDYFDLFNAVLEYLSLNPLGVERVKNTLEYLEKITSDSQVKERWAKTLNDLRVEAETKGLLLEFNKIIKKCIAKK